MHDDYKQQKRKTKMTERSIFLATTLTSPFFFIFREKQTASSMKVVDRKDQS